MTITKLNYDMYIHWILLEGCNFSCTYCYAHPRKGLPPKIDILRVIQRLDKINKVILFTFTGGEPFLISNFTEFIHELTKKHYVRIDTNLSLKKPCEKFMNTVNPKKVVEITFSIHVLEREKRRMSLQDLCLLVKKFQKKGFRMIGNYVAYPPLVKRLKRDIEFFKSQGLEILPTLFHGCYGSKTYPINDRGALAYSENDMQLISAMNPYAKIVTFKSKNKPCQAGVTAFVINHKYEVFPCLMMRKKLGNFFGEWK
ncbi:MAG: radical SAM protein, partial [Omnitrophica bacterium]|nr:radical SAM protein [Candidatus Omnitrophota bacterium]